MRPVVKTQQMERRYTVQRPVYQTVNQERRYTVRGRSTRPSGASGATP